MPLYEYACDCGRSQEVVRSVKEHTKTIPCECGSEARQVITPLRIIPDIQPYRSMVTGERIKGRSHHKQHLRQHGLMEVGNEPIKPRKQVPVPGLVDDIKRAIQESR